MLFHVPTSDYHEIPLNQQPTNPDLLATMCALPIPYFHIPNSNNSNKIKIKTYPPSSLSYRNEKYQPIHPQQTSKPPHIRRHIRIKLNSLHNSSSPRKQSDRGGDRGSGGGVLRLVLVLLVLVPVLLDLGLRRRDPRRDLAALGKKDPRRLVIVVFDAVVIPYSLSAHHHHQRQGKRRTHPSAQTTSPPPRSENSSHSPSPAPGPRAKRSS